MPLNAWFKTHHGAWALLALLFTPLLAVSASSQTPQPIFPTSTTYQGPSILNAFITGDFNGDGLQDVAFLSPSAGGAAPLRVVVLLNQGTIAAFTPITTSGLSCTPTTLVAADLNNDKKLDLALTCKEGYVVVLLGNDDGTFQNPSYTSLPNAGLLAPPVDLNGDGYLDLALTSTTSSNVSVLLNQGSSSPGIFSAAKTYSGPTGISFSTVSTVAVGDFNGDGKQDVVAGSTPLVVFYGNGDGSLQTPQTLQATATPYSNFATGDFNHDGFTDIAYLASTASSSSLQVLLGTSTGQFTTGSNLPLDAAAAYQTIVPAGSTNNRNNTDFALVGNNLLIALGDGNGGFTSGQTYDFGSDLVSVGSEAAGDGKANLIFNSTTGLIFVPGNGDGTFQALPTTDLGIYDGFFDPIVITPADLNSDGLTDVLGVDVSGNLVAALGRGNGRFTITSRIPGPGLNGQMVAGDFNGDDKVDAVLFPSNSSGVQLTFVAGNGDGTFQPAAAGIQLSVSGIQTAITGDFNNDKKLDIILVNSTTRYDQTQPYLYYLAGNADGTFAAPVAIAQQNAFIPGGNSIPDTLILTADLNGDNKADLIWDNTVFLGNNDGTFIRQPLNVPNTPLAVGDLNGDGIPDLVANVFGTAGPVNVYAGNGDGTFQTSPFYTGNLPPFSEAGSVLIGDVNADGHADLLVQYSTAEDINQLAVFFGNGKGNFTADSNIYFSGNSPGSTIAFARLNNQAPAPPNDITPDLLIGNAGGATSLLNQTNPAPTAPSLQPSTITLTASTNNTAIIQQLTLTATITGIAPIGSVTFQSGSTTFGKVPLTNGVATLVIPSPSPGTYSVTAAYTGDTNNLPSTSVAIPVTITLPPTTTTLTSTSPLSGTGNQNYTFTATVAGNNPTGSVTFSSGSTTLLTAPLNQGTIIFVLSGLNFSGLGTYPITATYLGDSNNAPSTSNPINVVISASDFVFSSSTSLLELTITAGQSATTTLTPASIDGYNGTVKFSCANLPAETTCTFSPPSVTLASGGAPQSTKLTITTTAPTTALLRRFSRSASVVAWAGLLCLTFLPRRIRRMHRGLMQTSILTLLLVAVLIPLSGCSSSPSQSPAPNSGTPVGTQQIAIVAADASGGPSHTIPIQLIIQ
jgi:hypothetical protein